METMMMGSASRHLGARPRPRLSRPLASNSNVYMSVNTVDVVDLHWHLYHRCYSKKRSCLRHSWSEYDKQTLGCTWLLLKKHRQPHSRIRRIVHPAPLASTDDSVPVNGNSYPSSSSDVEQLKIKLTNPLQDQDLTSGLVQSIHDAARAVELAVQEHSSSSRASWFSRSWLGVDKNAWVKPLSYQAAVYSLLQAALEIASRGDGRDRDTNLFVQRSLSRICAPLENIIQEELSAKQPAAYEWFWADQHPFVVITFVNLFESESRFSAATMLCRRGELSSSGSAGDLSLLMLALSCLAAVTKLGSTKVSCPHFFSMVPESTGRLMDMLLDFVPINQAYCSMKDIGLRREFLFHFGPRAASISNYSNGVEEISFWVDLIQRQLQRAIDREKIWSRLTTCESIEVLEKDLAIFGFFIALGRSTQSFLSSNGLTVIDESIESIIRYLIGGTVLYYPQLSSISSYQLYVEVVCEELEWLPFYQSKSLSIKQKNDNMDNQEGIPDGETIPQVLDVCFCWMTSFIKYSTWLENPSNIKAAKFLSKGHSKLIECMEELGMHRNARKKSIIEKEDLHGSGTHTSVEGDLDSFDKALENVEEALNRLEDLLQELHLSNSNSGKEHLKAACSDLERIRRLKKEAEFLEASFRAKAASLQQGVANELPTSPNSEQRQFSSKKSGKAFKEKEADRNLAERVIYEPRAFWSFLVRNSTRKAEGSSVADQNGAFTIKMSKEDSEANEIHRFELLRSELMELEKRVQRSTDDAENEEDSELMEGEEKHASKHALVKAQQKDSIISKSLDKIRETSTDVWQGTQLLAIDSAAAAVLLKRTLTGDDLTDKEKKALRRTATDLASVLPIAFLMLLPVTAVGHAAMLAAIQRYVPSLIPSTYGPERLDLLRQLEKIKAMETADMSTDETTEENSLSSSSAENL